MLFRSRSFLFRVALAALLAMMANAFMPAASQFVRMNAYGKAGKTFPLGEICSVSADAKSADPAKAPSSSGMAACAFCTLHADHPAILLPPAASVLAAIVEREAYPILFYQAPYRLAAWSKASPRGPPALS